MSMKNSIANRTRDLPACNVVLQPTAPKLVRLVECCEFGIQRKRFGCIIHTMMVELRTETCHKIIIIVDEGVVIGSCVGVRWIARDSH